MNNSYSTQVVFHLFMFVNGLIEIQNQRKTILLTIIYLPTNRIIYVINWYHFEILYLSIVFRFLFFIARYSPRIPRDFDLEMNILVEEFSQFKSTFCLTDFLLSNPHRIRRAGTGPRSTWIWIELSENAQSFLPIKTSVLQLVHSLYCSLSWVRNWNFNRWFTCKFIMFSTCKSRSFCQVERNFVCWLSKRNGDCNFQLHSKVFFNLIILIDSFQKLQSLFEYLPMQMFKLNSSNRLSLCALLENLKCKIIKVEGIEEMYLSNCCCSLGNPGEEEGGRGDGSRLPGGVVEAGWWMGACVILEISDSICVQ